MWKFNGKTMKFNGGWLNTQSSPTPPEPPEPPTPVKPNILWLSYIDGIDVESGIVNKVIDNTGNNVYLKTYYTSQASQYVNDIHTIDSADGILPESYIGKKYFVSTINAGALDQVNSFGLNPIEFTVGFWCKNVTPVNTAVDKQSQTPCNFAPLQVDKTDTILTTYTNTHGYGLYKAAQPYLPTMYNGTTKETFTTLGGDSHDYYRIPCGVGNVWHYCNIIFNRKIGTYRPVGGDPVDYGCIDYYVNGVKYLRQYIWTKDFVAERWTTGDNWYRSRLLSFNLHTDSLALMEIAVYEGKQLYIPTAPLH